MRIIDTATFAVAFTLGTLSVCAQQSPQSSVEQRVALNEPAVALDAQGAAAVEAGLRTSPITGTLDSPVTNVRITIKNVGSVFYAYVSGWATFYDAAGVRCGEGLFKVEALAQNESVETDTPGIRVRCTPATWRIVATSLLTRTTDIAKPDQTVTGRPSLRLLISIDGEEHPIQLDKPMVLTLGDRQRTITLRAAQ